MYKNIGQLAHGVDEEGIKELDRNLIEELKKNKLLIHKKGKYKLLEGVSLGKVDVSRDGTGFLEIEGREKDILIPKELLNGAQRGDFVAALIIGRRRGRVLARVAVVIDRKKAHMVCYVEHVGKKIFIKDIKNDVAIHLKTSSKSLRNLPDFTVLKIDTKTADVDEVLGVLDDPFVDEKISLALYNKNEDFSKAAQNQAKSYGNTIDVSLYRDRVDLRDMPLITIDPVSAKDHDDAIYFDTEEMTLYVAIADVSEYVTRFSPIDKEARDRGFSIYLPHKSIPMLPRELSENLCSLKEGENRLSFVFRIRLHKKTLKPIKEELFQALINIKKRYNYEEVDEFIEGKEIEDASVRSFLMPLYEVTKKLRKKRLEEGFDFRNPDTRLVLDSQNVLLETRIEEETPSHSLVEECMLLANCAAAKRLNKSIFRVHEEPDPKKLQDLLDDLAAIGVFAKKGDSFHAIVNSLQKDAEEKGLRSEVDRAIIRAQKQAYYSSKNLGHFGLGFESYTHFTSPIRRYSDLLLHRILKADLAGDAKLRDFIYEDIETLVSHISNLEREAQKVEWDFMDRKFARWAAKNLGKVVQAVVIDKEKTPIAKVMEKIQGARIFLRSYPYDIENLDKINVRIISSDVGSTRIEGEVL